MKQTQGTLTFIAQNLYIMSNIPLIEVDAAGELLCSLAPEDYKLPECFAELMKSMLSRVGKQKALLEDYPGLPLCLCIYKSSEDRYFVWGPVQYHSLSTSEQHLLWTVLRKDAESAALCKTTYAKLISSVSSFVFATDEYLLTPPELHSTTVSHPDKESLTRDMVRYMVQQESDMLNNHTYAEEQYSLELLKNGDLEKMQEHMMHYNISYPQVFDTNAWKTEEYMTVAAIGIMARAAIEGGVTSSESFRLSDLFLKKTAQCKSKKEVLSVWKNAFIEFTRLVQECSHRNELNTYVEDCKKDIASKITQKISLDDIAKDLGVEKTYLARLFSASEGITVGQYIRAEKMKLAKNMLIYSSYSIAEIANYLGFDSQSYFGKLFLTETGMTPNQYRRKNHPPEF